MQLFVCHSSAQCLSDARLMVLDAYGLGLGPAPHDGLSCGLAQDELRDPLWGAVAVGFYAAPAVCRHAPGRVSWWGRALRWLGIAR